MLTEAWRGVAQCPMRIAIARRHARYPQFAKAGLIDFNEEIALTQVLAFIQASHVVDRRKRDAAFLRCAVKILHLPSC